jgi:phenylpropionate dioxygenase-like ring-hydroxylating dioxygenase large terminal subunit
MTRRHETAARSEHRGAPRLTAWRENWFPVAFRCDLEPGRIERVSVAGRGLALFLDANGAPAALVDRCPHRSARLSDGRVRNGEIECLYHGWRFDARGACVDAPQQPRGVALPERACALSAPVKVEQGLVWVWGGSEGRHGEHIPHTVPSIDREDVRSVDFAMDLPYGQDYFVENVLDVAHIHIAHAGTRGGGDRRLAGPLEFLLEHESSEGFAATFRTLGLEGAPRTDGLRRAYVEFRAPNLVHYVSEFEDPGRVSGLALYSIPVDASSCRMLYRAYGNRWSAEDRARPRWIEHIGQCFLLEEDMAVVRGQAEEIDRSHQPLADMWLPLRASDALVLRYREWVEHHARDRAGAVGLRDVGARGVLSPQAKLDRWTLHSRHCADCRAAHARLSLRAHRLSVGSFVALAGAAAASGPVAWSTAALALALQSLARWTRRRANELTLERDVQAKGEKPS